MCDSVGVDCVLRCRYYRKSDLQKDVESGRKKLTHRLQSILKQMRDDELLFSDHKQQEVCVCVCVCVCARACALL